MNFKHNSFFIPLFKCSHFSIYILCLKYVWDSFFEKCINAYKFILNYCISFYVMKYIFTNQPWRIIFLILQKYSIHLIHPPYWVLFHMISKDILNIHNVWVSCGAHSILSVQNMWRHFLRINVSHIITFLMFVDWSINLRLLIWYLVSNS